MLPAPMFQNLEFTIDRIVVLISDEVVPKQNIDPNTLDRNLNLGERSLANSLCKPELGNLFSVFPSVLRRNQILQLLVLVTRRSERKDWRAGYPTA